MKSPQCDLNQWRLTLGVIFLIILCSIALVHILNFTHPESITLESFQDCVQTKASRSVAWVNKIEEKEARKIVKSVFEKCFNDLEPFGRRNLPSDSKSKTLCSEYLLYNRYKKSKE